MAGERRLSLAALLLCCCGGSSWTAATTTLDRVVLTVSGTADEVVVAGGGQGNGQPSLVRRLRSGAWSSLDPRATETLWWISDRFVVGERGVIYRRGDPLERLTAPTTATLFGVWGDWAVGGSPLGGGENDVILRFDGTAWSKVPAPEALDVAYFKVWGSAADDVWIVGQQGVTLHFDGAAWTRVTTPTRSTLLTVSGRSKAEVWAVGGPPAVLLRWDGTTWNDEPLPFPAPGLTGVSVAANGDVFVVGLAGTRWRRVNGTWLDDSEEPALGDLHAVWVAPSGEAWAVGGNYVATDPSTVRKGIVARFGRGAPPELQ